MPPISVAVFLPPSGQLLGTLGFVEVLDTANRVRALLGKGPAYAVELLGVDPITQSSPGPVLQTRPAQAMQVHTLVVGGALEMADGPVDSRVCEAVARVRSGAERVVAVCAGAFVLGELGLLDGRRCTTHWLLLEQLAERFPAARVERDVLYTEDGPVWTSAGAAAGIDLALQLVRTDLDSRLAQTVARALVVFAHRPGGQSQFGSALQIRPGLDERMGALVAEIVAQPAGDHRVEVLAARSGISPRHFARVFREQTGVTPAKFVARARVEAAQRALAQSDAGIDRVACDCGFGSEETLRRTFVRVAGVTPSAWRARFGAAS